VKRICILITCILLVSLVYEPYSVQAQSYLDLSIDQAIAIALKNNRDIKNASEEKVRANLRVTEAASGAFPQINGSWSLERNLKPMVFVISFPDSAGKLTKNRLKVGTDHSISLGTNITQPLYVGGKIGTAIKAARIYRQFSSENFNTVKQNVVMSAAAAYNRILLTKEMVKITGASLEQARKHLGNVEKLYKNGRATEYDLLRSRVNVANIQPGLMEAENNVKISLLNFKEILGLSPDTPLTIKGKLSEPDTSLFKLANPENAFNNRPDLKAAEFNVELQDKAIKIARGDFLPTLTAGTTFAYSGNFDVFKYEADDWTPYWFASINLSFPIFSGFKNYAKYNQAKVDYRKAKTEFIRTRNTVMIEVDESVMKLRKAVQQIESQQMNIHEAEKAVEIAGSMYTSGKATQLEVLDSQLAFEHARTNYASALFEAKIAEISLKKSLGLLDYTTNERD